MLTTRKLVVVKRTLCNWLVTDVRLDVLRRHTREVVLPAPRVGRADEMAARHFGCGDAKALAHDRFWNSAGRNLSSRATRTRVGTAGQALKVQGSEDPIRLARFALRPSLVDHRLWHIVEEVSVSGSNGASASRPSCRFCRRFASPWPVFRHHSPGLSLGFGIINLVAFHASRIRSRSSTFFPCSNPVRPVSREVATNAPTL